MKKVVGFFAALSAGFVSLAVLLPFLPLFGTSLLFHKIRRGVANVG